MFGCRRWSPAQRRTQIENRRPHWSLGAQIYDFRCILQHHQELSEVDGVPDHPPAWLMGSACTWTRGVPHNETLGVYLASRPSDCSLKSLEGLVPVTSSKASEYHQTCFLT